MNTAAYRVMMSAPSREVFENCSCLADAKRLAKWGVPASLKPRRIQERREGKWVAVKVDWTLPSH